MIKIVHSSCYIVTPSIPSPPHLSECRLRERKEVEGLDPRAAGRHG